MTRSQLSFIVQNTFGSEMVEGYNYNMVSLKCRKDVTPVLAEAIRERKDQIEAAYREAVSIQDWSLLGCIERTFCVWVPVPFGTSLNVFVDVLRDILSDCEFEAPSWA